MKSHGSNLLRPTALVVAAALVLGSALGASAQEKADSSRRTLEGTWWVRVTALTDCVSRTPLMSFSALLTFADGGTMTGTTANPGFAIGQRSPDHGSWAGKRAPHKFTASSVALILFTTAPNLPMTPGFQAGAQQLDQKISLIGPDQFTSDAITTFFDASGQQYRRGCATAVGERFE